MIRKSLGDRHAEVDVPALGIERVEGISTVGADGQHPSEEPRTLDAKPGLPCSDVVVRALHVGKASGRRSGRGERVESGLDGVTEQEDVVVALLLDAEGADDVPRLACLMVS